MNTSEKSKAFDMLMEVLQPKPKQAKTKRPTHEQLVMKYKALILAEKPRYK